MNPQTKKEIIAEISSNATKNIEQAVRDSLKRALPQEFLDKTTDETIKRIKSSTIPEFKSKGNKIRYEANNNILEKIDDAINSIKKRHIERCQEKLKESKALILKQQKSIRIAGREKDGWEVVKCYLSDDLASDSKDEKQLNKSRREAASYKQKRKANKLKDRQKQFRNAPVFRRNIETFNKSNEGKSSYKNQFRTSKICYFCWKEGHFQYDCPIKRDNFDFTYKRDWKSQKKLKTFQYGED